MTWIALGCILLILILGGSQLKALGRFFRRASTGAWRPGAAMLALAAFVGSAGLGARQAWIPSAAVFILGLVLSMGARRAPRAGASAPPPPRQGMGQEEARSILGVGPDAGEAEIQAAYLRLIRMAHPDQGGTSGLAAQLNAARDALSGKR